MRKRRGKGRRGTTEGGGGGGGEGKEEGEEGRGEEEAALRSSLESKEVAAVWGTLGGPAGLRVMASTAHSRGHYRGTRSLS